jgi:YidC/Oxa1 family membrane protein insertase
MGWLMGPIYTSISWILLRWHQLWAAILPGSGHWLGTDWPWILSIVFLVITVRIILFPIFVKQIRSQRAMQALQPKLKELQAKHKGDQQTLREEMMKLYQTEKVNPLMGCLPMFLQIPVFLGLFHVLQRLDPVQTKNTTLYGWTQVDWDSAARARLFGVSIASRFADGPAQLHLLGSSGVSVKILAGVLILIMMGTTFLTSRQMILKTGWSADPQQKMIQRLMLYGIPVSLLFSGWYFPIGVIVYWVTQNLFSLGQQYWVLHKYPPPVTAGNIPMRQPKAATTKPAAVNGAKPATGLGGVAARARSAFLSPSADTKPARSGMFGRRAPEPEPVAETRAAAPKVGAKPINPRAKTASPNGTVTVETTPKADDTSATNGGSAANGNGSNGSGSNGSGSSGNGAGSNGTSDNGAKVTPAKATPGKATPAKVAAAKATTPAKATTATRAAPAKAASKSTGTKATPAKSVQGKKSGSKRH